MCRKSFNNGTVEVGRCKPEYRIIHSDGPHSNFNQIFVLIKVCPKLKPLHTYIVPTLIKGCCQNFRLIRVFCYITFWLEVGVCSEIGVFTPMDPPSESLIKKSSDQKMSLIFSLSIANLWSHTKFR